MLQIMPNKSSVNARHGIKSSISEKVLLELYRRLNVVHRIGKWVWTINNVNNLSYSAFNVFKVLRYDFI